MKTIDAYWEKINLGLTAAEIVFDGTEKVEELSNISNSFKQYEYIVAKVPTAQFEIYNYLMSLGFSFIECNFNLKVKTAEIHLSRIEKRINDSIKTKLCSKKDLIKIIQEIDKGIFDSDRIYLDPYFETGVSAFRYKNWIKDEFDRGSEVYEMLLNNKPIGFFTLKVNPSGAYYAFLGGMYKDYISSGVGFTVISKSIEESANKGGKYYESFVSSNNLPMINIHTSMGFKINGIKYVFVKHNILQ